MLDPGLPSPIGCLINDSRFNLHAETALPVNCRSVASVARASFTFVPGGLNLDSRPQLPLGHHLREPGQLFGDSTTGESSAYKFSPQNGRSSGAELNVIRLVVISGDADRAQRTTQVAPGARRGSAPGKRFPTNQILQSNGKDHRRSLPRDRPPRSPHLLPPRGPMPALRALRVTVPTT